MNKEQQINQLLNEAFNSVSDADRAVPKPFLLTRINARLNKTRENAWDKASWLIARPAIAIAGLTLLLAINLLAVIVTKSQPFSTVATELATQNTADELTYTVATIDDSENTEP